MTTTKDSSVYLISRFWEHTTFSSTGPKYGGKSVVRKLQRTRVGQGLPNWKSLIRAHQNATTALSGTYDTINCLLGPYEQECSWNHDDWPGIGWGPPGPRQREIVKGYPAGYKLTVPSTAFSLPDVEGRASNLFLSKVRDVQQSVSAPTFIGEFAQTWRMLKRPAEGLWRHILGYEHELLDLKKRSKGKWKDPSNWRKALQDLWLEQSFGWYPLMSDISDAWKAMNRLLTKDEVKRLSVSSRGNKLMNESFSGRGVKPGGGATNYTYCTWRMWDNNQYIVRYRGDLNVRAVTTFKDQAAQWGFSPAEFLPTAWELLPWSFLIDYFASIGDYLDARAALTADVRWVSKTTIEDRRRYCYMAPDNDYATEVLRMSPAAGYVSFGRPEFQMYRRRIVNRAASALPTPQLYIKTQQSEKHLWNMLALLGNFNDNLHTQNPRRFNFRR